MVRYSISIGLGYAQNPTTVIFAWLEIVRLKRPAARDELFIILFT